MPVHEKYLLPGHQSRLGKSIKLSLSDASSLWPGINFPLKYYVFCQNFNGLCQMLCPQHQFEVKQVFMDNAEFTIRLKKKDALLNG